jgi:CspA family cold shock protein
MAEGTVRWFNSERGHGRIAPDGGGPDVAVHYGEIQIRGYKTLDKGDRVSFWVEAGPQGPRAVKVTPLGTSGPVPPPAPVAFERPHVPFFAPGAPPRLWVAFFGLVLLAVAYWAAINFW